MVKTIRLVVKMQHTSLLAADYIPDLTKLPPGLARHPRAAQTQPLVVLEHWSPAFPATYSSMPRGILTFLEAMSGPLFTKISWLFFSPQATWSGMANCNFLWTWHQVYDY